MKKFAVALLFISSSAWATYIPVNGSTVTVIPTGGGSFPITGNLTGNQNVAVAAALPAGTNNIGTVNGSTVGVVGTVSAVQSGTWALTGSTLTIQSPSNNTTAIPVSLSANQSVNVAQINAATPLMGNGATGAGSPRTTISNDNTAIANWGQGATGAAVPSGAQYQAGIAKTSLPSAASDGNLTGSLRDKFGRTVTIADCPRDLINVATMTLTSTTTETVFISSGAAGVFNDLVSVIAVNTSATATRLDFRSNGVGGTISFALYLPAGDTRGLTTSHIWPQGGSASHWTVASSASVADVRVYATYCSDK